MTTEALRHGRFLECSVTVRSVCLEQRQEAGQWQDTGTDLSCEDGVDGVGVKLCPLLLHRVTQETIGHSWEEEERILFKRINVCKGMRERDSGERTK